MGRAVAARLSVVGVAPSQVASLHSLPSFPPTDSTGYAVLRHIVDTRGVSAEYRELLGGGEVRHRCAVLKEDGMERHVLPTDRKVAPDHYAVGSEFVDGLPDNAGRRLHGRHGEVILHRGDLQHHVADSGEGLEPL